MKILGISAFYHDSAAALVRRRRGRRRRAGGAVHAQEARRRVPRQRHRVLPAARGEVGDRGLDAVVYYDKPITTFVRLLKTYLRVGPKGIAFLLGGDAHMDAREALDPLRDRARAAAHRHPMPKDLWFTEHHESHAAERVLPVAVRARGHPHLRRRRRVGDEQHRRRARQPHRAAAPAQLPQLARAPLLRVHLLLRVPRELGRVQADGPRALRRAGLRRPHPRPPRSTCGPTARSAWR